MSAITCLIHIVTNKCFPSPGGMERAVIEIGQMLKRREGTECIIYTRTLEELPYEEAETVLGIRIIRLGARIRELIAPACDDRRAEETARCSFLVLRERLVRESIRGKQENGVDILFSFFASTTGFLCQRLAEELAWPHVASIRGSDFSIGSLYPRSMTSLHYTAMRADRVVTTNLNQAAFLRKSLDRTAGVSAIYNAVSDTVIRRGRSKDGQVRFFSDTGFSLRKGTHILLTSFNRLHDSGIECCLTLIGSTEPGEEEYWKRFLNEGLCSDRLLVCAHSPMAEVKRNLEECDVYLSATLGEGCSNARLLALLSGVPIVTTSTGELMDVAERRQWVFLAEPGSSESFFLEMAKAAKLILAQESVPVCVDVPQELLNMFSQPVIQEKWHAVVNELAESTKSGTQSYHGRRQPRLLFFSHDGTGLGHLRRLSRIAESLQGPCASLVVTGHHSAHMVVPDVCEYVHLPSLDSLVSSKSRYWGRSPFLRLPTGEAKLLRRRMLEAITEAYNPDAIFMDFLPLGKDGEMERLIKELRCKKYYILRGVLDHPTRVRSDVLTAEAELALETHFDRIFVTCDQRIIDVQEEYKLPVALSQRLEYVGYVAPQPNTESWKRTRAERSCAGLPWIVCSAGGGKFGEALSAESLQIAARFGDACFDVVLGPRSALGSSDFALATCNEQRVRVHQRLAELPAYHASADVVVCAGGYNSLVESMSGSRPIVVFPVQMDLDDEQYIHAERLSKIYPVRLVRELHKLETVLSEVLDHCRHAVRHNVELDGCRKIRNQVLEDFDFQGNFVGE